MRCPTETSESAELLLAYTSNQLDERQAAAFARHALGCPACRQAAAAQDAVWQALEAWEAPPVSADFDRRLYQRVEKEGSWWDLLLRPFRPVMLSRAVPVAAAAAMLIAVGLWIQRPGTLPAAPESAQVEAVAPEQAEHAVQEMDMMKEFSQLVHADSADPRI